MRTTMLALPLVAVAAAVGVAAPAFAATATVTEANIGVDWNTGKQDTRPGGSYAFTTAYGAPAGFGTGALELVTADVIAKVQMLTGQDAGVKLSDVKGSISYWAKQVAADPKMPPRWRRSTSSSTPTVQEPTTRTPRSSSSPSISRRPSSLGRGRSGTAPRPRPGGGLPALSPG